MVNSYWYCLPYFTLPEFSEDCKIVKNNSLFIRDVLCSYKNNQYNPHIHWGGQYDPHYEYEILPQFKMCHKDQRNRIKRLATSKVYDHIYILFRANKKFSDKTNSHYITGYYEIDQNNIPLDPDYEDYTLYSKKIHLVSIDDAIDISSFLKDTNMYISKYNSETHGGKYHNIYLNYINEINNRDNLYEDYVNETNRLKKIFEYYEFEEGEYEICTNCKDKKTCPLIRRIKYCKLYDNLPRGISEIIKEHYKSTINIEDYI